MKRPTIVGLGVLALGVFALPVLATPNGRTGGSGGPVACDDGQVTWSPTTLWPPNHKMQTITIVYSDTDGDGDSTMVGVTGWSDNETINGVEMNGSGQPDPKQAPDVMPGMPGSGKDGGNNATTTAQVRAERSGRGTGRVYTLQVTCMDSMEMPSMQTVNITVTVPHDQGQH
jgi:hypothetical protein